MTNIHMNATDRNDAESTAWTESAVDLARTFWPYVVRHDCYGGYYLKDGKVTTTTRKQELTKQTFLNHFLGQSLDDVVGLHFLTPGESHGRFCVLDIDNHTDDDDPEGNERYVVAVHDRVAMRGKSLAFTWGGGGYHVWIFFNKPTTGEKLFRYGDELASLAEPWIRKPESFPKQSHVEPGKFGNWARLFGRHHKRRTWPHVFNGEQWVAGRDAVQYVLGAAK